MSKFVPHQITLMAVGAVDANGITKTIDLVETSYKNAYFFTRKWIKDEEVHAIITIKPGTGEYIRRDIDRTPRLVMLQCDGILGRVKREVFRAAVGTAENRSDQLKYWQARRQSAEKLYYGLKQYEDRCPCANKRGAVKHKNRYPVGSWTDSAEYRAEQRGLGFSAL